MSERNITELKCFLINTEYDSKEIGLILISMSIIEHLYEQFFEVFI